MIFNAKYPSKADIQALGNRRPVSAADNLDSFHDVIVDKPWGNEYLLFENCDVAVWILHIEAGQQTSMHCHPKKNTSLIVLGGEAICKTLDNDFSLTTGQGIYIGKNVFHQSINSATEQLVMMEIESPVDKFDLVRLEDGYGRISCGYESAEDCEKKYGQTIENNLSNQVAKKCLVGDSMITIGYAETIDELDVSLQGIGHATLSILDRHVWTAEGQKFYQVGQAFKFGEHLSPDNLNINTGFHYLLISGTIK
mgnify:CR=1 FL=1